MSPLTFSLVDKVHRIFLFNSTVILLDNAVDCLSICQSVPEILAIKVKSCTKFRRILDVFCLPKFSGNSTPRPQEIVLGLTAAVSVTSRGKVLLGYFL